MIITHQHKLGGISFTAFLVWLATGLNVIVRKRVFWQSFPLSLLSFFLSFFLSRGSLSAMAFDLEIPHYSFSLTISLMFLSLTVKITNLVSISVVILSAGENGKREKRPIFCMHWTQQQSLDSKKANHTLTCLCSAYTLLAAAAHSLELHVCMWADGRTDGRTDEQSCCIGSPVQCVGCYIYWYDLAYWLAS